MHHAVDTWHDIDEGTEIFDADNLAYVGSTDFWLDSQRFDPIQGFLNIFAIWTCHGDEAVFFDVDLGTSFTSDLVDRLTTLADDCTDLIGVDLDLFNTWCIWAKRFARGVDHGQHVLENVLATRC